MHIHSNMLKHAASHLCVFPLINMDHTGCPNTHTQPLTSQSFSNTIAGVIPDYSMTLLNPWVQCKAVSWRHGLICQWNSRSHPESLWLLHLPRTHPYEQLLEQTSAIVLKCLHRKLYFHSVWKPLCWNDLGVADFVLSGISCTWSTHCVPGTQKKSIRNYVVSVLVALMSGWTNMSIVQKAHIDLANIKIQFIQVSFFY